MKKLRVLVLCMIIIVLSNVSVYANEEKIINEKKNTNYDFSEELILRHAKEAREKLRIDQIDTSDFSDVPVLRSLPDGIKSITEGTKWSPGGIYWGNEESSSKLDNIINTGITVGGYFINTAGNIVIDIADSFFNLTENEIDFQAPGEARAGLSYVYQTKYGKSYVKDAASWKTHVYIEQRFVYKHTHVSFKEKNSASTKQKTVDYIPENGYSHIDNNKRPYYDDHDMIYYLIGEYHRGWGTPAYQIYSDGYTFG